MSNKRIQKRWKRENRNNKGENTERARLEKNAALRSQRDRAMMDPANLVLLAALAKLGRS